MITINFERREKLEIMDKPSVGRIVHYVLHEGRHLPAIITDVNETEDTVNLFVFWDPLVPRRYDLEKGAVDCKFDKNSVTTGTWHWPERV